MSNQVLVLENYATKEISLSQKSIKEILKDSEGNLIVFSKATVKKNLQTLVKKHEAEITKLIELPQLSVKEEQRLTDLRKLYKDSRISLDKITKHNSSVLAGASKQSKVVQGELTTIVQPVEDKITVRLDAEQERRDQAREQREREEEEKKNKLKDYIATVKADLEKIIVATTTFEKIDHNKKQFNSVVDISAEHTEKGIDLQEFQADYDDMILSRSEAFQKVIDNLTNAHDLEQREVALAVTELTNTRKGELLDYGLNYKGETALGELSLEEYTEIMVPARINFRIKELEGLGFTADTEGKVWLYLPNEMLILCRTDLKEIRMLSDESWAALIEEAKSEIEKYNTPAEAAPEAVEATEEVKPEEVAVAEESPAEEENSGEGAVISLMSNANSLAPFVGFLSSIDFEGRNAEIAKDQPEYNTLNAYVDNQEGSITSCWELTEAQIEEVKKTGKIWIKVLTFGNPLQPLQVSVVKEDLIN